MSHQPIFVAKDFNANPKKATNSMMTEPLKLLMTDVPPAVLAKTLDAAMIDYAICSIRDQQSVTAEEAVMNIQNMQRMRDAFKKASKIEQLNQLPDTIM